MKSRKASGLPAGGDLIRFAALSTFPRGTAYFVSKLYGDLTESAFPFGEGARKADEV